MVDRHLGEGKSIVEACMLAGLGRANYYRWKADPADKPEPKKAGRKAALELTEKEVNRLRFWRLKRTSIPLALAEFCNDPECRPEVGRWILGRWTAAVSRHCRPSWPLSVRRALYVTAAEEGALRGEKVQRVLSAANTNVMALYLWHMVPVVIVAVLVYPTGLMPQPTENSLNWWLVRGLWVLILTVVTAFEMVVLLRLGRIFAAPLPTIPVRWSPAVTDAALFLGVAMASYGITFVSAGGFAPDGHFPWHSMIIFAVGAVLVSLTPRLRSVAEQPGSGRGSVQLAE